MVFDFIKSAITTSAQSTTGNAEFRPHIRLQQIEHEHQAKVFTAMILGGDQLLAICSFPRFERSELPPVPALLEWLYGELSGQSELFTIRRVDEFPGRRVEVFDPKLGLVMLAVRLTQAS